MNATIFTYIQVRKLAGLQGKAAIREGA